MMGGEGSDAGEGSDGGPDGEEENGGAGLSFRPRAVVFVRGWSSPLAGGGLRSWAEGVVSWALIIRASGSLSSALSFVVAVAVLGAGLSFVDASSSFVSGGARSRVVYVLHGWGADVCGRWSLYTRGGGRGSSMCGVAAISSWRRPSVSSYYAAPASGCERGIGNGGRYSHE